MAINFNAEPYYDDFSEDKKFLKILFRPGYGVQARELNQLQSILQNQISRVGDHLFKDGSMVIPGEIGFDNYLSYVKLTASVGQSSTDGFLAGLVGDIIVGSTSGVRAKVLTYTTKSSTDPSMIYVKYLSSGTDGLTKVFQGSETLTSESSGVTVTVAASEATGIGSGATIQQGVFYVKKHFVLVETQTIVLSKFTRTPTTKVCLQIVEDIVTPEEDETLLDNAAGSYNYSAPGAHRYSIALNLVRRSYDFTIGEDKEFIEILRLKNGNIEYVVNKTAYNIIEDTLARRTYEESGNYVVNNFPITIKEWRDNNRGVYAVNKPYLSNDIVSYTSAGVKTFYRALNTGLSDSNSTPRTTSTTQAGVTIWQEVTEPEYNNGVYTAPSTYTTVNQHLEDEAKLAVGLGSGKAYIFGYEVENRSIKYTAVSKARDSEVKQDILFALDLGQYTLVKNLNYFPDVSTYPEVKLYENLTVTAGVSSGIKVGSARIRAIDYQEGTIGSANAIYKVFLFNVVMDTIPGTNKKYQFTNRVKQLSILGSTKATTFTADVSLDTTDGSGTVIVNGNTIFGTGTRFFTEFEKGEYVYINGIYAKIDSEITNDTTMVLDTNVSGTTSISIDGTNASIVSTSGDSIAYTAHGFSTGNEISYSSGNVVTSSSNAISTNASTNVITVPSTTGMVANDVIIFGNSFGGIQANVKYYIKNVASGSTFTISDSISSGVAGDVKQLTAATSTSSLSFTAASIGGLVRGNTYYVYAGTNGSPTPNSFILYTTKSGAEAGGSTGKVDITAVATNGTAHTFTKNTTSGVKIQKAVNPLYNQGNTSAVYSLPQPFVKSISDSRYTAVRTFTGQISSGSVALSLPVSSIYQFANPTVTGSYTLVNQTTGNIIIPAGYTRSNNNLTIEFTGLSAYNTNNVIIQTTLEASSPTPKIKTLKSSSRTVTDSTIGFSKAIYTGKPDVFKIRSVMMDTGTWSSPTGSYTQDITDRYKLKNNQTDSYYGISYIQLKDGKSKPAAPIIINFEYLEHTGTSDFFDVTSYNGIPYSSIPTFNGVSLRDCIDFRPKVVDSFNDSIVFADDESLMPKYGTDMVLDFEYYLGKKCKLSMDRVGKITISEGSSALNNLPEAPDVSDTVSLYKFELAPYTLKPDSASVMIQQIDNKRYTMSDIGKLEKRISNLEYYTSLSLLESETQNLTIKDVNGLEKFKNGFVVDNFSGHSVGDTSNPDYLNSMDFKARVLRPFFTQDQVPFVEVCSTQDERLARNYTLGDKTGLGNGKYITLPYSEVSYVKQIRSSTTEKINPFAFFTFLGTMTIVPASDTWFEVNRRPDLIVSTNEGNYNTIKSLAEQAGVLGTIWNAWTYNWAGATTEVQKGVTYSAGTLFSDINNVSWRGGANIASQSFSIDTVRVSVPRSRTGIETYVQDTWEDKVLEDKVVSTTLLPYMRSRRLVVQNKGLKSDTVFYPYFAGKSVSEYCTPAERIIFTAVTGQVSEFDTQSRAGSNYTESARLYPGESVELAVSMGDVLTAYDSTGTTPTGVTGIVVGWEKYTEGPDAGKLAVWVVNRKYPAAATVTTFLENQVIKGSLSEAYGTVVSHQTFNSGDAIKTSRSGSAFFTFKVPNTDYIKFNTGTNELTLLDVSTFERARSTSSATKEFSASGVFQERQNQIQRIRSGELATKNVAPESASEMSSATRYSNDPGWYDPLAQTFLITETNGVFVTSIDLFFFKKDETVPVTVQLREVVNGYPGKNVINTARVTIPASKILTSTDASVATNVRFTSPTYLNGNTEYAIILLSDSDIPEVFVARMGDLDKENGAQIDKQPYMGSFFKSQNGSTWTAEQSIDLKFVLYKAQFETNIVANVAFENSRIIDQELSTDPFYMTAGSRKVRVSHSNHGMNTASVVAFKGIPENGVGTIYSSTSSAIITGVSTKFATSNPVQTGAIIYRSDGKIIGEVLSIQSDTQLTLKSVAASNYGSSTSAQQFGFINPMNGVSPSEIFKMDSSGNYIPLIIDSVELDSYVITLGTDSIAATLSASSTTVSNIDTRYMFVGQPVIKTSGTGVFASNTTVASITSVGSAGSIVLSATPTTAGAVVFSVGDIPTDTGNVGGNNVRASRDVPYDLINPAINIENYTGTSSIITYQGLTGRTVDGTQTPYQTFTEAGLPYINTFAITPGSDNYMPVPMCMASNENAVNYGLNLSNISTLRNSAIINVELMTTNPDLSPIINVENVAVTTVSNKINNPSSSMNIDPIDYVTVVDDEQGIVFDGTKTAVVSDSALYDNIKNIVSGQYIRISINGGTTYTTYLVDDVDVEGKSFTVDSVLTTKAGTVAVIIKVLDRYFTEKTPVGASTINKYVTRKMRFANPCTSFKVIFDADIPLEANVGVYYKLNPAGTETDFNFTEYQTAQEQTPAGLKSNTGAFAENDIEVTDLPEFDAITIKITMTSTDSTKIPRLKDLRIIALA